MSDHIQGVDVRRNELFSQGRSNGKVSQRIAELRRRIEQLENELADARRTIAWMEANRKGPDEKEF